MNDKKIKGQLGVYLQWPLFLGALVILMNVAAGLVSLQAGLVMCGFTLLYLVIAILLYIYKRKGLLAGMVEFSADYAWIQKKLLSDLDIPYGVADETGRMLWMNDRLTELLKAEKGKGRMLTSYFPEVTRELLEGLEESTSVHSALGEGRYRVNIKPVVVDTDPKDTEILEEGQQLKQLIAVYLFDETEILKYRQEIADQKMVAGLIYLDNYDEALESVEEVRVPC